MARVTRKKIRELLSQNEGPKLDFKQSLSLATDKEKLEFTKDVCAIANTGKSDGYIIVGIEDKTKRVLGINPNSISEERLQQFVSSRSDPPPVFSVEFPSYKGAKLAVIYIPREKKSGTLHQIKRVGFPIRRGSITDTMNTSEIFTVLQTQARRTHSRTSKYEVLNSYEKNRAMREDTLKSLLELGFSSRETKEIQQLNDIFVTAKKTINRRKLKLYFHFSSGNADRFYIARLEHLVGAIVEKTKSRAIFISIVQGSLSTAFLRLRVRDFGSLTLVPISPSIFYFGVGKGVGRLEHIFSTVGHPRFFAHRVKSKEDIKARIRVILGWIGQHEPLFSEIDSCLRRFQQGKIRPFPKGKRFDRKMHKMNFRKSIKRTRC